MSTKTKVFIAALCLICSIGLSWFWIQKTAPKETISYEILDLKITPQEASTRAYTDYTIEDSVLIGLDSMKLYSASKLLYDDESIYVTDYGDVTIKRFSKSGQFLNTIGMGRGEGPGEYLNPVDITIKGDSFFVFDGNRKGQIFIFLKDGTFLSRYQDTDVERITASNDAIYAKRMFYVTPAIFSRVNEKGEDLIEFGEIVKGDPMKVGIVLDGWIETYQNNLLYSPFYFPVLCKYDEQGQLKYARATMNDDKKAVVPETVTVETEGGVGQKLGERVFYNIAISTTDKYVYLNQRNDSKKIDQSILDVYEGETGDYVHSYLLPGKRKRFVFADAERFYTVHDTLVTIYNYKLK